MNEKRTSRRGWHIGMIAGLAAVAVGCTGLTAIAEDIAGDVEYGYWGNPARGEVTEAVNRLFEQKYPGTSVQGILSEYYAYIERLTVQAAAGDLPCITQTQSTFLATYTHRGVLLPLDDLIAEGVIDISTLPEAALATGNVNGKQYMIPTGIFVRPMAYNATMADAYGIPAPPDRGTWKEFADWARAAQDKLPDGVFAVENEAANLFALYSWFAGHGEKLFDDNGLAASPEMMADWFRYWEDLRKDGIVLPADRLDEQFGAIEVTPMAVGAALSATRDIPHVVIMENVQTALGTPTDIAFVSMPVEEGAVSGNVPGANGLSISANCSNVPTAAAFIDFFTNDPDAAVAFQSSNGVVASSTGMKALLDNADTPANVKRSIATLERFSSVGDMAGASYPPGYQGLQALLRRVYEQVAFSGLDPDEAASNFLAESVNVVR